MKYHNAVVERQPTTSTRMADILLIAHCELNPIELVWAQVKGYAAGNDKKFTMTKAFKLLHKGIEK